MTNLRTVLYTNAAFSASTAVLVVLGGSRLARWLGLPLWFSIALGIGLAGFAGYVYRAGKVGDRAAARIILGADLAWVIGTAIVLVGFPELLTVAGRWFFAVVGLVVGDLAVFEWIGLRRPPQATVPGVQGMPAVR